MPRTEWRFAAAALVVASFLMPFGCAKESLPEGPHLTVTYGAGGTPTVGSTGGAGGSGAVGGNDVGGGMASAVRIGINPNPLHKGDGTPTASEVVFAELTSYAAGVRAVVLVAHWSDLASEAGMTAFVAKIADAHARGLDVIATVDVVDRRVARRPAQLAALGWDHPENISSIESVLLALVAKSGGDLRALVIGHDVDVYAAIHPNEAKALQAFLTTAVSVVQSGPNPPLSAVGLSYVGPPPNGTYAGLAAYGSALAISYAPGLGQLAVSNAAAHAKDLDAMAALAGMRPVLLTSVSFTSAAPLGATADAQAQHVTDLVAALQPRRAGFPVVNLSALYDPSPSRCAAYAKDQGLPDNHPEVTYLCNAGVRDNTGATKKAWYSFLAASATYAQP